MEGMEKGVVEDEACDKICGHCLQYSDKENLFHSWEDIL